MLNPKQIKCLNMMVYGDMKQKDIAEKLKVSENTITNWKKNDEFRTAYVAELKNSMRDVAAKAFKTEVKLLEARSESVRLMAAKDILDRAGFKPEENVNLGGSVNENGKVININISGTGESSGHKSTDK